MTKSTRAELFLVVATLFWGSTFALGKMVLAEVTPLEMVLIRFGIASVVVGAVAWKSIFPIPRAHLIRGGILGSLLFIGFLLQTTGLLYTTASKSAFLTGLMVVFVPALQLVMERKPPKIGNVVGVVIVSAGLWMLTSPAGSAFNSGDALTIACSVVFGVHIVYLDVVAQEIPTARLMFLQLGTNALFAGIGVLVMGGMHPVVSRQGMMLLAYLTLFPTIVTFLIQTRYQKDTTPVRAVVIYMVEPVFAAVIAWIMLGEQLGMLGLLGGGTILAGVLLSELSESVPGLRRPMAFLMKEREA